MASSDYYEILGVSKNATDDEIQRAYRKLARKYHPDVSKAKDADKKFKELSEARDVLKDPEKRKLYDTYGRNYQQEKDRPPPHYRYDRQTESGGGFSRSFHFDEDQFGEAGGFDDILEKLFQKSGRGRTRETQRGFEESGRASEAEITVSLSDVFHGASKTITLQSYELGHNGTLQPVTRTLQVKIPKGITDGAIIRLAGQGEKGGGGRNSAGDLLLHINIAPDQRFRADGHDLHTVVAVSPWEAVLGAGIPVQTMEGKVTLSIPRGSQNGRKLRLRGKGMPTRSGAAGDIIVELEVRLPDHITLEEEKHFLELANTSKFNPRAKKMQRAGNQAKG